jgi:hypothetical protein
MKDTFCSFIIFCLCLNLNAQSAEHHLSKKIDWFKNDLVEIKAQDSVDSSRMIDYGGFRLVGWSKNGLIAYIFSQLTTIACEREERFYIYDLKNNKSVWQMFACSVDWNNSNNKYVSDCIDHLIANGFTPANSIFIKPIKTKVSVKDSVNYIEIYGNKRQKFTTITPQKYPFCQIQNACGYITSPYDKKLLAIIFPSSCAVETVFIFGIKM